MPNNTRRWKKVIQKDAKCHQKTIKSHQKHTKTVPNWWQNVPRSNVIYPFWGHSQSQHSVSDEYFKPYTVQTKANKYLEPINVFIINLARFYTTNAGSYPTWKIIWKIDRITTEGNRKYQKRYQMLPKVHLRSPKMHPKGSKRVPKGYQIGAKTCQGLPKWCSGPKVSILFRFATHFGSHFGPIFFQKSKKMLKAMPPKSKIGQGSKIYDQIMRKACQNGL